MVKASTRPTHKCTECGWTTVKWVGRCGRCQAWGTVEEAGMTASTGTTKASTVAEAAPRIADVDATLASFRAAEHQQCRAALAAGGCVPGADQPLVAHWHAGRRGYGDDLDIGGSGKCQSGQ